MYFSFPEPITGRLLIWLRSILSRQAERAYSVIIAKLTDGEPAFVSPPDVTYNWLVFSSRAIPFWEWFSSDRGRPLTRSVLVHVVPSQLSKEIMPELVSS